MGLKIENLRAASLSTAEPDEIDGVQSCKQRHWFLKRDPLDEFGAETDQQQAIISECLTADRAVMITAGTEHESDHLSLRGC